MTIEEMAEFMCDNFDCSICPAFDANYCTNYNLTIGKVSMKKYLESEVERLTAQRDKAVKDFTEFARIAFEIPFACKHCVHSVENGRACLWKEEHEDEEKACLDKHFEYREMVGDI